MDKKEVKELIKGAKHLAILRKYENRRAYLNICIRCLEEALEELSKSDWISVEDRLPEFGENVVARTKGGYMNVSYRRKIPRDRISKEIMDDNGFILNFNLHSEKIAYWHKIDKLEE